MTELRRTLPAKVLCKDCDKWYGQDDGEYGPCMYKNLRKEKKYLTYGYHECDEVEELELRVRRWRERSPSGG